ncbi:hypothetical protein [Pseudoalteromonas phage Pq0]|uniref:hypothetical protein n=1 Tax=Pseudoalteromonas phage Pq0 TaxID=1667322 RepID=UPI00065521BA|nr:hypothetical protein AXI74_gp54 [Pseudoalteromonas phage Pq0]AKN44337.1 hypothetical protein [Pseudoalteromonas phage Pq0]
MNLVGYTATALSRNDIEDTPTNKNVVDFAIVELKDLQGNLVVMYDDAEGLNPEKQKICDTDGQVTFFAEIGDYDLEINGKAQRINLSSGLASFISTKTDESVQDFVDSFALKIFQSPTDGGLTEIQTRTVDAGEVYEVRKTSDDSLATIYSDAAGTTEILQDGTDNKSGSDGVVEFYISNGDYYIDYNSVSSGFSASHNSVYESTLSQKVSSLISRGDARIAILGDSTEAGVGNGSGNAYGECRSSANGSHFTMSHFDLISKDKNFIPLDPSSYQLSPPLSGPLPIGLASSWVIIGSDNPTITQRVRAKNANNITSFTVYILERTSDAAPAFDVTIRAPVSNVTKTETVDTYTPAVTFGDAGTVNVAGRLVAKTFSWTGTNIDYDTLDIKIDNFRGVGGAAGTGTALIFGFAFNDGVKLKNFAVSSTTLEDNSPANQARGVTTTGRIDEAVAWGANCFFLGWGTNDSKDGGLSLGSFYEEYRGQIEYIKAQVPDSTICLCTDPKGSGVYINNVKYNELVRQLARSERLCLFDVENLAQSIDGFYDDDVHPSSSGYLGLSKSINKLCTPIDESNTVSYKLASGFYTQNILGGLSDLTGSFVEVASIATSRPSDKNLLDINVNISYYLASGDLEQSEIKILINGSQIRSVRFNILQGVASATWDCKEVREIYQSGNLDTYVISVELKNYSTRDLPNSSWVNARWI